MRWEQKAPTLGLHPELAPLPAGRPEAPLALTHKDMCLVFCAFASWAVKTSDLQAPDAWKTGVWCVGLGKEGVCREEGRDAITKMCWWKNAAVFLLFQRCFLTSPIGMFVPTPCLGSFPMHRVCCLARSCVPQFYPRTAFAELVGTKVALRRHQDGIEVAPGCWEICSPRRSPGSRHPG